VSVVATWRAHWREYAIEAFGLGVFMISAVVFATLFGHPSSPLTAHLPEGPLGRAPMALAMGATAVAIVYSPWGRRSGAHLNPALTLAQFRLGKVSAADLIGYAVAQFLGAVLGVGIAAFALFGAADDPAVRHAATLPGAEGRGVALLAEAAIGFVLLSAVLWTSARPKFERYTGLVAAGLVALYIAFEAPLSGMSLNPARSFGSAAFSGTWEDYWIYALGPTIGMLAAAEARRFGARGGAPEGCAKLRHDVRRGCIFCAHAAKRRPIPDDSRGRA
jgi:aquaporin Z